VIIQTNIALAILITTDYRDSNGGAFPKNAEKVIVSIENVVTGLVDIAIEIQKIGASWPEYPALKKAIARKLSRQAAHAAEAIATTVARELDIVPRYTRHDEFTDDGIPFAPLVAVVPQPNQSIDSKLKAAANRLCGVISTA
jgi:hypothetical protein